MFNLKFGVKLTRKQIKLSHNMQRLSFKHICKNPDWKILREPLKKINKNSKSDILMKFKEKKQKMSEMKS